VTQPECDPAIFGPVQRATELDVYSLTDPYLQQLRAIELPVIEYFDRVNNRYFMTQGPDEINELDLGTEGWQRTGYQFFAFPPGNFFNSVCCHTVVQRFYNPSLNSHFFSFQNTETAALPSSWQLEIQDAFEIWEPLHSSGLCPQNTLPVYRLWNGLSDSNWRYTIDPGVRSDMISQGWIPQGYDAAGVVMCSPTT
jgi:hypothetical protein